MKMKLSSFKTKLVNLPNKIRLFIKSLPYLMKELYQFSLFFILLVIFMFSHLFNFLMKLPLIGKLFVIVDKFWQKTGGRLVNSFVKKAEQSRETEINRLYLIRLAYKNLLAKKTRSLITIFGMSVGIGIIVLLLSLGYGVERLIISRVASLDELRMIDVSSGSSTALKLRKETIDKFKKMPNIEKLIPVVSLVGKITYNKATTDVLVYSTPNSYFDFSKLKMIKGKFFSNNMEYFGNVSNAGLSLGQVAGIFDKMDEGSYGKPISKQGIYFNIFPKTVVSIWKSCDISSKLLGYTARVEGGFNGQEYWGGKYYPFNKNGRVGYDKRLRISLGKWIKAKVPLYTKNQKGNLLPIIDDSGVQKWEIACLKNKDIQTNSKITVGEILGEATSSAQTSNESTSSANLSEDGEATESALIGYEKIVASGSGGLEFVSIQASESATTNKNKEIEIQGGSESEAIVSSGLLNLLNIPLKKAIGLVLKTKLVLGKNLIPGIEGKVLTSDINYKIIGVIEDSTAPYFYISFTNANRLSISNISQVKIILKDKKNLSKVRKMIEIMGFKTSSTTDTVKQIENLFRNLRFILGIVGLVALGVASLGMFNTLTVSLLERTREIGGMKTMGVVSQEVQDLFLAEAMIMGLSGGIGGLLFGFAIGQVISVVISIFAIARGQGFISLTYLPLPFVVFIIASSFVVGIITGLYPAQRAKKISALNALRYE